MFSDPPPKLLEILRREKATLEGNPPKASPENILKYLYCRDPEALDEALATYEKQADKEDLRCRIVSLVKKHPKLAKKVIDSPHADDALRSEILDVFSSHVPKRKDL